MLLFFCLFKFEGVAPEPLLYVWYFPYLLTAALHVKLPLESGIDFMASEVKNRKIVSVQKPPPGKTLLPPGNHILFFLN